MLNTMACVTGLGYHPTRDQLHLSASVATVFMVNKDYQRLSKHKMSNNRLWWDERSLITCFPFPQFVIWYLWSISLLLHNSSTYLLATYNLLLNSVFTTHTTYIIRCVYHQSAGATGQCEKKKKKQYLYSAFIQRLVSERSHMDHTVLLANYTMPAFPS